VSGSLRDHADITEAFCVLDDASVQATRVLEVCERRGIHPDIERFRDLLDAVDRARDLAGGYCGGDPEPRPE
jgi:hypothetical protein